MSRREPEALRERRRQEAEATCSGKTRYQTPQLAWQAAQRNCRRRRNRKIVSTYRCPFCGLFHVGRAPKVTL